MYDVFKKLNQFLGGMSAHPPLIGQVAKIYLLHLGPSGTFPGQQFGCGKTQKQKTQKAQKNAKNAKYVSSNKGVFLKAWGLCQRQGNHAKGIGTMPKAWGPCQRHEDHAKGMVTMLKA